MLLTECGTLVMRGARRTTSRSLVREERPSYEDEGSTRESRGAVTLPGGAWWSAVLRVPLDAPARTDPSRVQIQLARHAAPGDVEGPADGVELLLPVAEVDGVVRLLAGVVAQARRDAVLPPLPSAPWRA